MKIGNLDRRQLLRLATVVPVMATTGYQEVARGASALRIDEPIHGAVLNHLHGEAAAGGLKIDVAGSAPLARSVTVNGERAERRGDRFFATAILSAREHEIVASMDGIQGQQEHRIKLERQRMSGPRSIAPRSRPGLPTSRTTCARNIAHLAFTRR